MPLDQRYAEAEAELVEARRKLRALEADLATARQQPPQQVVPQVVVDRMAALWRWVSQGAALELGSASPLADSLILLKAEEVWSSPERLRAATEVASQRGVFLLSGAEPGGNA